MRRVGHLLRVGLVSGALAAAAVGIATAPAGSTTVIHGIPMRVGDTCTHGAIGPTIGFASMRRASNTVSVQLTLTNAAPYADYYTYLFLGMSETGEYDCTSIYLGTLVTNFEGMGKLSASVSVPNFDHYFWLGSWDEPYYTCGVASGDHPLVCTTVVKSSAKSKPDTTYYYYVWNETAILHLVG